mgnify:FL=1
MRGARPRPLHLLALLLLVAPPMVSSAHLLLDRGCDHTVSVDDLDPEPCPFLALLLHAEPAVGEPSITESGPGTRLDPVTAPATRPPGASGITACPSRAPPRVDTA